MVGRVNGLVFARRCSTRRLGPERGEEVCGSSSTPPSVLTAIRIVAEPMTTSEDIARLIEHVPGCFVFAGNHRVHERGQANPSFIRYRRPARHRASAAARVPARKGAGTPGAFQTPTLTTCRPCGRSGGHLCRSMPRMSLDPVDGDIGGRGARCVTGPQTMTAEPLDQDLGLDFGTASSASGPTTTLLDDPGVRGSSRYDQHRMKPTTPELPSDTTVCRRPGN
jgi:hypothetical protein